MSVSGLILCDECSSVNRVLINEMNEILKYQNNVDDFASIFQDHEWTVANGSLDCHLFYKDLLKLIEQGNVKLAKLITLTITSQYHHINLFPSKSNTSYSDITRQKVESTISFSLNEHEVPPLSNVCHPILSNVSESRLYQCKPASNLKLVSVHVSLVYTSSVSELVKSLNVSKLFCSRNATKHNVCKVRSVSQLVKPLNVGKTVSSNNVTGRNVCKVSSVSQLVKPSTVSKPARYNNVTQRNVRKVSSISQLAETFDITNLSVSVMQVISSFVIPLVNLFIILLVIISQPNLFVKLMM